MRLRKNSNNADCLVLTGNDAWFGFPEQKGSDEVGFLFIITKFTVEWECVFVESQN